MISHNPSQHTEMQRWLITIAVMLAAVIEVLDMTIVNVALPNMMGALGASADQITWVLTSYIVSSAIVMPLTGFLVGRLGRKKLLLLNIVGFLAASMLCGASSTLSQIVLFRILQGIFGAALVPLSQYILRDTFPPEQHTKIMAIWGIGIMAGPIFGPTLGGYITDAMNWRWIFYINIPVCIIAFIMAMKFLPETKTKKMPIDAVGLFWMALGIGCLQIFLDQGNQYSWFDSDFMLALFIIFVFSLGLFITRGLKKPNNIINLRLFTDRNFTSSTLLLSLCVASCFGLVAIQPIMLEDLMGFSPKIAGLLMAPRGIACAFSMMVVAKLSNRYDPRLLIAIGLVFSAVGTYMMSLFTLDFSAYAMVLCTSIQGMGMGFFFVPLSALALSTLPKDATAEGSGLFSFGRSLGSSIGISVISTILTRETQINWNRLGGHIYAGNEALQRWLFAHHLTANNPLAHQLLGQELERQATMIGFIDCYYIAAISFLFMLPLVLFMSPPKYETDNAAPLAQH